MDMIKEDQRPNLALPVHISNGRVFWSRTDMVFRAEHFGTSGAGKTRSITPKCCGLVGCQDAVTIATRPAGAKRYHHQCWVEHAACKTSLIDALIVKDATGEWGELRWRKYNSKS